jgi:hypothetical protein
MGVGLADGLAVGLGEGVAVSVGVTVVLLLVVSLSAAKDMGTHTMIARIAKNNSVTVNVLLETDILITLVLVEWRSLARHLPWISTAGE